MNYTLVETEEQLIEFGQSLAGVEWVSFDTEFVGEKRFRTLICLIQIYCPKGNFLLDTIRLPHIDPLLDILEDPNVLKITHAGENDYRLIYQQYNVLPKNVFDTQIASAFLAYRYPTGLAKLVSGELKINLGKGYGVTDWTKRPFSQKQLTYALEDVVILEPLWQKLTKKLAAKNRLNWALEASSQMEKASFYYQDPNHEALTSNLITSLRTKEQVFLIRLYQWRKREAQRLDQSKNMILPTKLISHIVKGMKGGKQALLDNRRIPDYIVNKFAHQFLKFYDAPATAEEKDILERLPVASNEDSRDEILLELLYLLMKYKAVEEGVSHALVMPRNAIKRMKNKPEDIEQLLGDGWRRELLGEDYVQWLEHYHELELSIEGGQIAISIPEKNA